MNRVQENVLIPKDEYETLLEKVKELDGKDHVPSTQINNTGGSFPKDKGDDEVSMAESSSLVESPSGDVNKLEDTKSSNLTTPNKDEDKREEETTLEDINVQNETEDAMLENLLTKVSSNLKESVRLLGRYILQNGEGLIEWDKDLRFIHLKEIVPKSNIVKIMTYVLENNTKPPKGATLFKRSLKSIGISNPKSWVFSQSGGMMSPYGEGEKKNEGIKRSIDSMDGSFDTVEKKKVKKSRSKGEKLKKLSTKWIDW